jgi:hypothetical protein
MWQRPIGEEKYILRNEQNVEVNAQKGERGRRRLVSFMRSEGSIPAVAAMDF